jgi:hypothetical protein
MGIKRIVEARSDAPAKTGADHDNGHQYDPSPQFHLISLTPYIIAQPERADTRIGSRKLFREVLEYPSEPSFISAIYHLA